MGFAEMVVAIVLITAIAGVLRARYKAQHGIYEDEDGKDRRLAGPDVDAMAADMKRLKERVAVLERIATDKNQLLEQEFDRLRDEPSLS